MREIVIVAFLAGIVAGMLLSIAARWVGRRLFVNKKYIDIHEDKGSGDKTGE
jgi:hypothetical protein